MAKEPTARVRTPRGPRSPSGDACALTIAGLDPSGGAGIAADLRGFAAAEVWGTSVCALITVQSTAGLRSAHPLAADLVLEQATEVLRHQNIRAIKTGALGSPENVRVAVQIGRAHPKLPLIVDPVMIATRTRGGARLLEPDALEAMRELAAQATLVTPNVDDAEAMLEGRIRDLDDLREAAVALVAKGARAALVKGGHLSGDYAADVLATKGHVVVLRTPRRKGPAFHGGGCTLAALVAGGLAARPTHDEDTLIEVVRWAKRRLTTAISRPRKIGDGLLVLDPLTFDERNRKAALSFSPRRPRARRTKAACLPTPTSRPPAHRPRRTQGAFRRRG
jgi:hydroxymethylpyrimidine/phosphomethylpyrimidine kinase